MEQELYKTSWGIIGFGEAGSAFAAKIAQTLGRPVQVVDPLLHRSPPPKHLGERLKRVTLTIAPDIASLVQNNDIVLSLVTPGVASTAAQEAAAAWRTGLFIDFNSVAPSEKQQLAARFPPNSYVDGSILGSVSGQGVATPLAVSGKRANEAHALLTAAGFSVSMVGLEVGAASALKMCRSIFMKGLECLFVETLVAADQFGVTEPVLSSIAETIASYGVQPLAKMLATTHAIHCGRRSEEMAGVVSMLEAAGLPDTMCRAARDFLEASARSGITQYFAHSVPDEIGPVIAYFREQRGEKSD